MKHTVTIKREVEVTTLDCDIGVRYWEDAMVDGVEDADGKLIPLRSGEDWKITIDLETGKIQSWPNGITAKTHYKVCDAGVYSLLDVDGNVVAKKVGYVPRMLCPKENGYGDYVIMEIDGDGVIDGFKPDLSYFNDDTGD